MAYYLQAKIEEMTKQKTALEWFAEFTAKLGYVSADILKEAQELERLQHGLTWDAAIEAHEQKWHLLARSFCDFDEYYKSTYDKP